MQSKNIRRVAAAALLAGLAGAAQAHPGHGANSLMEGLAHPFGLDHLLAMVAVGVHTAAMRASLAVPVAERLAPGSAAVPAAHASIEHPVRPACCAAEAGQ